MRVLIDKFLLHFGCITPKALHKPQTCPRCHRDTLVVSVDPITDATIFHCATCQVHYDAIQFSAWLNQESIADALPRFYPGGNLSHVLQQNYTQNQLQEYTKHHYSQGHIQEYVRTMHHELASALGTSYARGLPMFRGGSASFSPSMGLVSKTGVPAALVKLDTGRFQRNRHFSFAYTYNNRVVSIAVRELQNIDNVEYVNVAPTNLGVFMEEVIDPATHVLNIAPDELTAAVLYFRAQSVSNKPLQVVATRDLPLPPTLRNVDQINLLSYGDHPLSLQTALRYLTAPELIEAGGVPECYVCHQQTTLEKITAFQLQNAIAERMRLITWIAHELVGRFKLHGEADIISLLAQYRLTQAVEQSLVAAFTAIQAPSELKQLLAHLHADMTEERRLTNGRRIIRSTNGFLGFNGPAAIPLSDTWFKVTDCVRTRRGEVLYNVMVYCQKAKTSMLKITLKHEDFRSNTTLRNAIQAQYIARGEHVAITFYDVTGYDWNEIRDAFLENCTVLREIEVLGADENGNINLPNCLLNVTDFKLDEPHPLLTFDAEALRSYNAIRPELCERLDAFTELWLADTPEHAALAAGICHVIDRVRHGMLCQRHGTPQYPQHLIYVDISLETWLSCMQQLSLIFSGSEYVAHLPHNKPLAHMLERKDLGSLPYICQLPKLTKQRALTLVQESPISLLALAENETGGHIGAEPNVRFIAMEQMTPRLPGRLSEDMIARLRAEFASLLIYFLRHYHNYPAVSYHSDTNSVIQAYDWIADLLQLERQRLPGQLPMLCKKYYKSYSFHSARAFFNELRAMFYAGGARYTPQVMLRGATRPKTSFAVFEDTTKRCVYIHKQLAEIINQQNPKAHFTADTLTQEMTEAGYLVSQQEELYWAVHEDVWYTHVANQLRILHIAEPSDNVATA